MAFRTIQIGMLLASAAFAVAADTEYSARVWRTEDGLPQNKVQAVSQTPDGYLWIGTSGGLVRFDGVRFVNFDRSNTPSLPDDSILVLRPASDGSLWIGTEGGGLVRMKGSVFETFGAAQGLTNGFVRSLLPDTDGRVWVGTDRGFFLLESGKFQRLDARGSTPIVAARAIAQDRAGIVWVGTSRGLFAIRNGEMARFPVAVPVTDGIADLLAASDGSLWLACDVGIRHIVGDRVDVQPGQRGIRTRTIRQDHEGNVWVGTVGDGLIRIGTRGLRTYKASDVLPDNTVWSVFEDRERNLWAGTQDGLLRLAASAVRTITSRNGLADDNVGSVYEDPAGQLWIGTMAGQLHKLQNGHAVLYRMPAAASGFRPRNIYVDRNGVQWIGSLAQGLLRIETGGPPTIFKANDGLRSNSIRQVLQDRRGTVWIATGSGLSRWDGHAMRTYYLEDGLAYGGVRVLAEDLNGDLLVGTDGGLNRVRDDRFVPDPVFARLGNERIWSILVGANGSLWIGTRGNGMLRIRSGKTTRYTTREGLLSNSIYQILDNGDRFWMSSSVGIFSADSREMDALAEGRTGPIAVVPYGTDDGMLSSQMSGGEQSAGCRTRSGEFWFPSVKGAVEIDPRQLPVTTAEPVTIESIMADDQPRPVIQGMTIPPGRGKLEVNFTSPNLVCPDRLTFRYRLEGFEEAWTSSGRSRVAYYTNLPAGKYRLHVVARDGAQPDRVSEVVLPFIWKAHFYETPWFYALLTALAGLSIWAVFRLYARQTRARFALVLAERTRLAREMHDTVIQGCVGVSTLLEAAHSLPPSASGKVRELLDRAATQARLTVSEAREAVWDLRHSAMGQPGASDEVASGGGASADATDFAATIEDFARQVSAAEGIPVRAEIAGAPGPMNGATDRNLLLVAREAIRNAVTHAHAARIDVLLRFDPGEVRLEVRDDGQGFTVGKPHETGHYGIVGMRERVEQLGGCFRLVSGPGKGTQVVARFPLNGAHLKEEHARIGADG